MLFDIPGILDLNTPKPELLPTRKKKRNKDLKRDTEISYKTESNDFSYLNHKQRLASKFNKDLFCKKLSGARFRQLNELLYTSDSNNALKYFSENAKDFEHYHEGWKSQQQNGWKIRPIDIIRDLIVSDFKDHHKISIADMGCGEAILAELLSSSKKYHVNSFDFVSTKPNVIVCDTSQTPLADKSMNVVVFSLSLMNTNYGDSLLEASRILRLGGKVYIAEVESRFDSDILNRFITAMTKIGFTHIRTDSKHRIFILMEFTLSKPCNNKKSYQNWPKLKPCIYKRR